MTADLPRSGEPDGRGKGRAREDRRNAQIRSRHAEQLHAVIKAKAPVLSPKLWYGMPAYAMDGKVVCFFQSADKFKSRYATVGFNDTANLDESTRASQRSRFIPVVRFGRGHPATALKIGRCAQLSALPRCAKSSRRGLGMAGRPGADRRDRYTESDATASTAAAAGAALGRTGDQRTHESVGA